MTFKEILKLLKALTIGLGCLFFSAKIFIEDYKIDKRIENELYTERGTIKSFSYRVLPETSASNAAADPPTEVIFNLEENKSFYSDRFNQILFNCNYDTTLFTGGHEAILKVSKHNKKYDISQFVELSIDGKQLLNIEQGKDEYQKTEGKYFLLVFGLISTFLGIWAVYFFKKRA